MAEHDEGKLTHCAKALGSKGGKKGGLARAAALSPERRREIARMGGLATKGIKKADHVKRKRESRHEPTWASEVAAWLA